MVVVPVDQSHDQDPPQDTNPPLHIPNLPPLPNLPAHMQNLPTQPPNSPQNPPPQAPMQPPKPSANPPNPMQPQSPPVQMLQLSWSYFKSEFSGKPEEDTIPHLLRTNDWMETHNVTEAAKVQRFCLTLTGEVRLWYETLRPIEVDWTGLLDHFRQSIQSLITQRNSYSMCGDHSNMMKI